MTTRHSTDYKAIAIVVLVALGMAISGAALYGLWRLTGLAAESIAGLRAWAMIATLAVPMAGWITYRLGRVESRGFISGAEKTIDKMTGLVESVSTIRDNHRPAQRAPGAPAWQVGPNVAQPPLLTYRATGGDGSDDL